MQGQEDRRGRSIDDTTPGVGRRAVLGGALAATATIGGLAVLDVMPFVDVDVPFVPRDVTLDWLDEELTKAGLDTRAAPGWSDAGRPGRFRPSGVLIHHTGFRATQKEPHPALATVVKGRPGLPGPLCHVLVDRRGACHLIAAGRANHAGESKDSGPIDGGDGNTDYVGIEIEYAPQEPYGQRPTAAQGKAVVAAAAAIVARLGHGADHVRYHAETSTAGKWDPGNTISGDEFRKRVDAVLATISG